MTAAENIIPLSVGSDDDLADLIVRRAALHIRAHALSDKKISELEMLLADLRREIERAIAIETENVIRWTLDEVANLIDNDLSGRVKVAEVVAFIRSEATVDFVLGAAQ